MQQFYIARPSTDTAATLNAQLADGKNLPFTPGVYNVSEPIHVMRPNAVVLGLGFATLRPTHGTPAMCTEDVDGIEIAGLLFDAGAENSPVLLDVGHEEGKVCHEKNPITLHDVFCRVGGGGLGARND